MNDCVPLHHGALAWTLLRRCLQLLLVGVAANVLFAWVLAFLPIHAANSITLVERAAMPHTAVTMNQAAIAETRSPTEFWQLVRLRRLGAEHTTLTKRQENFRGRAFEIHYLHGSCPIPPILRTATEVTQNAAAASWDARGFPFRSMYSYRYWHVPGSNVPVSKGLQLSSSLGVRERALPLAIHWPAFAGNVAFYSGILALVWCGSRKVASLASARRRREGRCSSCGYLLVGCAGPRCPECGGLH
jgi:hypothetical protein